MARFCLCPEPIALNLMQITFPPASCPAGVNERALTTPAKLGLTSKRD